MQTQPVTNQTNFNGRIIFEKGTTTELTKYTPDPIWRKYLEIAAMVKNKSYDIFIMKDKNNEGFYNISANKSIEDAKKVKEYSVRVKSDVIKDSIVNAAQDAIDMYEKFIAKNCKG